MDKLRDIAQAMDVHPMTILALCHAREEFRGDIDRLFERVTKDLQELGLIDP